MTRGYRSWFQDLINVWTMPATMLKNKVMYRQFNSQCRFCKLKMLYIFKTYVSVLSRHALYMFGLKPSRRTPNTKIHTRGRYLSSMQPPMNCLLCYTAYNPDPQRQAAWYTHINHPTLKLRSTRGQNIPCSTQCFPRGKESKNNNIIFCYIIF